LFTFSKSKPAEERPTIRDTLFGDMPLWQWMAVSTETLTSEPWASFKNAKHHIDSGNTADAIAVLQSILEMPELESRHYLQACHFLRELGVNQPQEEGKDVLRVIVEVGMKDGVDLIVGYSDHHARYYNYSGAAIIWEKPDSTLDASIDVLLQAGQAVVRAIGPWKESRPPAPRTGNARINLLTPSGLHFGEGPYDALWKDPMGRPLLAAAYRLMHELIELTKRRGKD